MHCDTEGWESVGMKIYRGWSVVAISAVTLALVLGASIQGFGLFVLPVSEHFRLSRADINTAAIALNVGMAVIGPFLGRLLDKHSSRLIMAVSAIVFGASFVVLGLSNNVWLSLAVIALPLAVAVVGCGTLTSTAIVARWFNVYRGRAIAIAMIGLSLGPVAVVPVIGLLIEAVGWRYTLVALGVAVGVVLVLLAAVLGERPGPDDVETHDPVPALNQPAPEPETDEPLSAGHLLRLPQFWTISLAAAFAFAIMTALLVSLVPYAQGVGLSLTQGANLMSMYGLAAIAGTLLVAWLGDRFDRLTVMAVLSVLIGIASALLLLADGFGPILACTGMIGLVSGALTPVFLALLADLFGAMSFGIASGTASFLSTIIGAIAIRFGGEVYDRTGSYRLMFLSFLIVGLLAAVLAFATGPLARRHPIVT